MGRACAPFISVHGQTHFASLASSNQFLISQFDGVDHVCVCVRCVCVCVNKHAAKYTLAKTQKLALLNKQVHCNLAVAQGVVVGTKEIPPDVVATSKPTQGLLRCSDSIQVVFQVRVLLLVPSHPYGHDTSQHS